MEHQRLTRGPRRQRGISLVELMISMTIGLVILAALLVVYLGSRGAFRTSESLAATQERGRFAVDFLVHDLRQASYLGCRSRSLSTADDTLFNITATPAVVLNTSADGINAFEDGTGWTNPTAVARVRGDVMQLLRVPRTRSPNDPQSAPITNHNPAARTITVQHNRIGLGNGDIVMAGSCQHSMLFRVTNTPGIGPTPQVIEFQATGAGPGGTAGNLTGVSVDTLSPNLRPEAMRLTEIHYFIGNNALGRPALYRSVSGVAEELVDNVEDMDLLFAIDSDGDGLADNYTRANGVVNWGQVISVRISMVVVGDENNFTTNAQTYAFRDTDGDGVPEAQTAPDRRLRQVFTSTVALRNRLL
jgi:type IV pilus assembly protein PilW